MKAIPFVRRFTALRPRFYRIVLPLLCGVTLLTGCTSLYNVTFSHGSVITAKGRPKLDPVTDTYSFTDTAGRRYKVPALTVRQIAPASDSPESSNLPRITSPGR